MRFPLGISLLAMAAVLSAHEGPDPTLHWILNSSRMKGDTLEARFGPSAKLQQSVKVEKAPWGEFGRFEGKGSFLIAADHQTVAAQLPKKEITVAGWYSVNERMGWGGILSCIQDNGNSEQGWILGYNGEKFYFGLASQGLKDEDGKLTYLESKTEFELGRMYFVVGTYDGKTQKIYVNGKLESQSSEQSGPILYPKSAPFALGAYQDENEYFPHVGKIRDVAVYDVVAPADWIKGEFGHSSELAAAEADKMPEAEFDMLVKPYLQYATQDGIVICWETAAPGTSKVFVGESESELKPVTMDGTHTHHQIQLKGLKPYTAYYYKVESQGAAGKTVSSELLSFQTAAPPHIPFTFAVIGDTQDQPHIAKQVSDHAWTHRPNFLMLAGDLVGTGANKKHWTEAFFPSMHSLISRVCLYPAIGNHEGNAKNYYDYMNLPAPEYYYTFNYGNAQCFMLDSNKDVSPTSEQYKWLEEQLKKSTATWKFVCYHHPSYSSDEDDYGNTWKGRSTQGDLRMRSLVTLYDRYGVDIVFNGHIHSYERTWPLMSHKPVERNGTIYVVTGGGGGGLETPGPVRPIFANTVRRGHHFCIVRINGRVLEFKAYDIEGRLFDQLTVERFDKPPVKN